MRLSYVMLGNISVGEPSFVQNTDGVGFPDAEHSNVAMPFSDTVAVWGRVVNVGGAVEEEREKFLVTSSS